MAEYRGQTVELNKPRRTPKGDSKKFEVFVQDGDKVKRVTFGDPDMEIRRDDDEARASFRARHKCDQQKDKTTAAYWSCRMWEKGTSVSDLTKAVSVGDRVSWNSSGGTARGIVRQIVRDGKVPDIPVEINGTEDDPAARIELLDDEGKPRKEYVGHKVSTLRKSDVIKLDEEERMVYGWASVITENGEPVIDRQGDVIKAPALTKAVTKFMEEVRVGKAMHEGEQIGQVIHSWPVTDEISKSVGIESNREGWLVAFKVHDENIWKKVKSGELSAFSIGGKGVKNRYDN